MKHDKIDLLALMATNHKGGLDRHKFAELIIQECGNALSPMLRDMISRGQAYELIKKHFGVEE